MLYFHTLMFARWRFLQRCVRTVNSTFHALVDRAHAHGQQHISSTCWPCVRTVNNTNLVYYCPDHRSTIKNSVIWAVTFGDSRHNTAITCAYSCQHCLCHAGLSEFGEFSLPLSLRLSGNTFQTRLQLNALGGWRHVVNGLINIVFHLLSFLLFYKVIVYRIADSIWL